MIKVAILDYGTGNIASLSSAINSLNAKAYLGTNLKDIKNADALILPGVGHFGHALNNLKQNCLIKPIIEIVKEGLPTLGICLGFQILTLSSEEAKGKQQQKFDAAERRNNKSDRSRYWCPAPPVTGCSLMRHQTWTGVSLQELFRDPELRAPEPDAWQ